MKIVICGSRFWYNTNAIRKYIRTLDHTNDIIITGGARGADLIANTIAKEEGFQTIVFNADWRVYGNAAGPIRNKQMLELNPDIVVAFHNDIDNSKGTKNCVTQAKLKGIKTIVITGD